MPTTPLNFFDDEELLPLDNVLEFLKIAIDEGVKDVAMIQSRQQDLENLFKNGSPGGLKDKGL